MKKSDIDLELHKFSNTNLSINSAIKPPPNNSNHCENEILKIKPFPQRMDSLENQLKELVVVAEKLGMYYAAHFIMNIKNIKK